MIRHPVIPLLAFTIAGLLAIPDTALRGAPERIQLLRVGATGTLTGKGDSSDEEAGVDLMRAYLKEETGLNNEIAKEKDWQVLLAMLAKGQVHVVVFQGYEYAWAQEHHPELRPMVVAINGFRYPTAHVMVRRDHAAKDYAGLRGQTVALPAVNQEFVRLYVDRQCAAAGKPTEGFFSKLVIPDNAEDAMDDVVDGQVQVAIVEGVAFDAYRRRKPGRFSQLRELTRSPAFPPMVFAHYGSYLDENTLQRFRSGLLAAAQKRTGARLLMLSRLSAFEPAPAEFTKVLAATRLAYPLENKGK